MSTLFDTVALSLTPSAWRRGLGAQLRAGTPPAALLRSLAPSSADARLILERLPGAARAAIDRASASGIGIIAWSDPDYPPALAAIDDPPPVLWGRGDRTALSDPAVALVGSRAGSEYAVAVTDMLAADLARAGVIVISGLARGVDSVAHAAALQAGGRTVAVLGSGVDVIYPTEHAALAAAIIRQPGCAVVSELPPGTRPRRWFFPLRNRIISGLCRAVVVVEAGEKSGSLITARTALEQGRDVLAVPGSILSRRNAGGHALLRDGARLVESAADVFDELNLTSRASDHRMTAAPTPGAASAPRDPILAALPLGDPRDLDAIATETGLSSARLLPRLFELELRGVVRRAGGGRFVRLDRSC